MNSFSENLECLKTALKRKDLWQDLCDAYKEALCEIADRTRMDSWIASKLFLKYNYGIWKTDIPDLRYQLFRVAGLSGFTKKALVVKEIPISEIGNLNTFITDPNEDLWEIKKAKEDYYINKLMSLETGSLMKDATVWFDNKSMPLDTFKAKCLGQILLTGPYKVYIKRTGTQVDKLNACNMSVTSYTITYK